MGLISLWDKHGSPGKGFCISLKEVFHWSSEQKIIDCETCCFFLQVQALAAIIDLKKATRERPEQIAEAEAYHDRKQKQLQQLQEAALSSDAHRHIAAACV